MYILSTWIYGIGTLPQRFSSFGLHPLHLEQRDDGTWVICVQSAEQEKSHIFDEVLRELRTNRLSLWNIQFNLRDDEKAFERAAMNYHTKEVVGFRLWGDHYQQLGNPLEDFSPCSKPPCRGILKPDTAAIVHERPTGLIAGAGHRLLVRKSMYEYLMSSRCQLLAGEGVLVKGVPVPNWCQLDGERHIECLDSEFYVDGFCFACESPTVASIGIYFGREFSSFDIGFDVIGTRHFGQEKTLVVSCDFAESLEERFGSNAEYGIAPIFSTSGELAKRTRRLLHQLLPFKADHPARAAMRNKVT
jgi:hypothetical protein